MQHRQIYGADLIQIISKHVKLQPGRKMLKGECPFYADESTSFMVSPDKDIFKYFGCGKEGWAIEFIMAIERKMREEAIRMLSTSYW